MNGLFLSIGQSIALQVLSLCVSMWRTFALLLIGFIALAMIQRWLEKRERQQLTGGLTEDAMQKEMQRQRDRKTSSSAPSMKTLRSRYRQRLVSAARYRLSREEALRVKREQYADTSPQYARMIINNVRVGGGWASDSDISSVCDWASEDLSGDSALGDMAMDDQMLDDDDWMSGLEER